jgi:GNAT superfamily N-acetyltransferase
MNFTYPEIQKMTASEIRDGLRLSLAENWNQTERDWQWLLGGDNNTCLVAKIGGKVVGTTTATNYKNRVAWIGMVLVDKEFRGQGISKKLLKETFSLLADCRSVKLDATPAGHPVYEKLGFRDEYIIQRMTRLPEANKPLPPVNDDTVSLAGRPDLAGIISMDAAAFGADRDFLIREMVSDYPELAFVSRENGKITGFVLGRRGCRFVQIGPLCAGNEMDARALVAAALKVLGEEPVVVDVPSAHEGLTGWLESYGFIIQRPFTRMFLDKNPFPGIPQSQFLICGPEFG